MYQKVPKKPKSRWWVGNLFLEVQKLWDGWVVAPEIIYCQLPRSRYTSRGRPRSLTISKC